MAYNKEDLKNCSESELRKNLDWQKSLMEHYDDIFDHGGYHASKERAKQIEEELLRRKYK